MISATKHIGGVLSGGTLNINIMATYVSASGYIILYRAVAREDPKALAAEVWHCKQMDNLQKAIMRDFIIISELSGLFI